MAAGNVESIADAEPVASGGCSMVVFQRADQAIGRQDLAVSRTEWKDEVSRKLNLRRIPTSVAFRLECWVARFASIQLFAKSPEFMWIQLQQIKTDSALVALAK